MQRQLIIPICSKNVTNEQTIEVGKIYLCGAFRRKLPLLLPTASEFVANFFPISISYQKSKKTYIEETEKMLDIISFKPFRLKIPFLLDIIIISDSEQIKKI
ncbi:MAG: hypothetical protein WBA93_20565 [Microcoleaceae cyanobacterium]